MARGKSSEKVSKRAKKQKSTEKIEFHDCESDSEVINTESEPTQNDLSLITQNLEDPTAFYRELQEIVSTTQQLLVKFDNKYKPTSQPYPKKTHRKTAKITESDRSISSSKSLLLEIHIQAQPNNIMYHQVSTLNENMFQVLPAQTPIEKLSHQSQKLDTNCVQNIEKPIICIDQQKPNCIADDEVQLQKPVNVSNHEQQSPYANNSNLPVNTDEETSFPTSVSRTEPDEYTISQTNSCLVPHNSQSFQPKTCTSATDDNSTKHIFFGPDTNVESKVPPQLPINYSNQTFVTSNNPIVQTLMSPVVPVPSLTTQSQSHTQSYAQFQQQQSIQFSQTDVSPYNQLPGSSSQPIQNYQAIPSAGPSVLRAQNYQTTAPGLPPQFNFPTAAAAAAATPLMQGQPQCQGAFFIIPDQPHYQTAATVLPPQPIYQVGFPGLPGQPNFQATIHSNYVSYNQHTLGKTGGIEKNAGKKKLKRKCYTFANECEYYSADSEDEEELQDHMDEYIEEQTELKKKPKLTKKKSNENITGDARTDLIKKLMNELVILLAQSKNENKDSPKEENTKRREIIEVNEGLPNGKFTLEHETKFKKHQDVSETSERWVITTGKHSNTNVTKGPVTGWQPGAEKITFDDEIIVDENPVCQNEIKVTIDNTDKKVEAENANVSKLKGQGDSKTSNRCSDKKSQSSNSKVDCPATRNDNNAKNICENSKNLLENKKIDTKKINGKCNCCHCRAIKEDCPDHGFELLKKNGSKLNSQKKFLELICPSSDLSMSEISETQLSTKLNQLPVILPFNRPTPKPVQPLLDSFPVTITSVNALGHSSLYVKWTIHDCYNIGGYEIYVDNYLTNRYFNSNHTAAVVCNIDVNRCLKIVLVAQPKIEDIGEGPGKNSYYSGTGFSYRNCPRKWTPSVYLYDPTNRD